MDLHDDPRLNRVEKIMIQERIRGDARNYVLIADNQLIDGDGDESFTMSKSYSPIGKGVLVHKKFLRNIIGRDAAKQFWDCGMRVNRRR